MFARLLKASNPCSALIVLAALCGATLCGCSSESEAGPPDAQDHAVISDNGSRRLVRLSREAEREADLSVETVDRRTLDVSVEVPGEVLANANTQMHVTTPVTGRVTEILVKIGDQIKEGKPLLIVRSTDIQQAESDLLQGEQQVRSDLKQALVQVDCDIKEGEAQVQLSHKVYERLKGLVEEKIASQADFQQAETQYRKDQIGVEALHSKRDATISLSYEKMKLVTGPLKAKLKLFGVSDAQIEQVMHTQVIDPMVPVLAPEEGIVVDRLVNVGELIDPAKPLFTIGKFDTVWLKADVYAKDMPKVDKGQAIELEAEGIPGQVFRGRLDYVANQVDPDTRTLAVRAEVANLKNQLRPKMFARMKILVGQHQVLAVNKDAVQDAGTDQVVYVPTGANTFEERKVTLGVHSGNYVEVLSGLAPGERVVTRGSFALRAEAVRAYG